MSENLWTIQRRVYGILDLLGDVGGLAGSLYTLFFALIIVFQYKAALTYVSQHTYQIRDGDENPDSTPEIQKNPRVYNDGSRDWKRLPLSFF